MKLGNIIENCRLFELGLSRGLTVAAKAKQTTSEVAEFHFMHPVLHISAFAINPGDGTKAIVVRLAEIYQNVLSC